MGKRFSTLLSVEKQEAGHFSPPYGGKVRVTLAGVRRRKGEARISYQSVRGKAAVRPPGGEGKKVAPIKLNLKIKNKEKCIYLPISTVMAAQK